MTGPLSFSNSQNPYSWYLSEYWEMDRDWRFSHWDGLEWQIINDGLVGQAARWEDDGGAVA